MHRHVEQLIGRLVTDALLRSRFAEQPLEVLQEQGLELSEVEIAALTAIAPSAIHTFAAAIDARLRKATPTTNSNETEKEIQR